MLLNVPIGRGVEPRHGDAAHLVGRGAVFLWRAVRCRRGGTMLKLYQKWKHSRIGHFIKISFTGNYASNL